MQNIILYFLFFCICDVNLLIQQNLYSILTDLSILMNQSKYFSQKET